MSVPNSVAPTICNVSLPISRSTRMTSPPGRASHRSISGEVSVLIVSSKPLTLRLPNTGCISLRCLAQCGPSFVTSPLPATRASAQ